MARGAGDVLIGAPEYAPGRRQTVMELDVEGSSFVDNSGTKTSYLLIGNRKAVDNRSYPQHFPNCFLQS